MVRTVYLFISPGLYTATPSWMISSCPAPPPLCFQQFAKVNYRKFNYDSLLPSSTAPFPTPAFRYSILTCTQKTPEIQPLNDRFPLLRRYQASTFLCKLITFTIHNLKIRPAALAPLPPHHRHSAQTDLHRIFLSVFSSSFSSVLFSLQIYSYLGTIHALRTFSHRNAAATQWLSRGGFYGTRCRFRSRDLPLMRCTHRAIQFDLDWN